MLSTRTQANNLGQSVRKVRRASQGCEGNAAHRENAGPKANAANLEHRASEGQLDRKANAADLDHRASEGQLDHRANAAQLDRRANAALLDHTANQGQPRARNRAHSCCAFSVEGRRSRATQMRC